MTNIIQTANRLSLALACLTCITFPAWAFAADNDTPAVETSVLEAQQQRIKIMQQASKATISIFGLDGGGGGSGVIVSPDGYALTNYHVSSACGDHMRCGLDDGRVYDAVIVGIDATGDVSLIKLLGRDDFPTAPLANSDEVRVGQWCFAAGNPFVLATNLQPSISLGIVSGVNRYQYPAGTLLEYADCIQTDAAINPGNSGGPLFNLAGEVIGINGRCSFEKRGRVNVGVGYAISSNQIRNFLGMLKSGRLVDHATLGATVSTDGSGKVLISNILTSSDAYRRGLRYGDEVVGLADREVRTTNSFKNILGTLPKDWRVPLTIRRDGELSTLLVRLEGVHTESQLIELVSAEVAEGHGEPDAPDPPPEQKDELAEELPAAESSAAPNHSLVQSLLEPREGFANYYFNRLHRKQMWEQLQHLGDYSQGADRWVLRGKVAGESTPIEIILDSDQAAIKLGSREVLGKYDEPVSDWVANRREKGLLAALRALRELLEHGPEEIGDSTYLGLMPVYQEPSRPLSDQPRHQVFQTLWYDAVVHFSFDPEARNLSLVEIFGDEGQDPVEVYLSRYTELTTEEQRQMQFPGIIQLKYGTDTTLVLQIEAMSLPKNATNPEGAPAS